MVYYILNGAGGSNTMFFNYGDIEDEKNGIVGLEMNSKSSMEAMYNGTIGTR